MCPETTDTAPNSPIARALQRITPYNNPHLMFGSVVYRKTCQPGRTENDGSLLFLAPLRFHQRNQFPGDKRKGDEDRRQDDARHGENDLDVVFVEPGAKPALRAEHQHVDQARDHRRYREGQIDQG
jgi:hypothetical protein